MNEHLLAENDLEKQISPPKITSFKCFPRAYWFLLRKPQYFLCFIPAIFIALKNNLTTYLFCKVLDSINLSNAGILIARYSIFDFIVSVLTAFLSFISQELTQYVRIKIERKVKSSIFLSFLQKDVEFMDNTSFGDMISVLTKDSNTIISLCGAEKYFQIRLVIQLVSNVIMSLSISWLLTAYFIAISLLGIFIVDLFRKTARSHFESMRATRSKAYTIIQEVISNMRIIQSFNRQDISVEKIDHYQTLSTKHSSDGELLFSFSFMISRLLNTGALVILYNYGATLVLHGKVTPGKLYLLSKTATAIVSTVKLLTSQIQREMKGIEETKKVFDVFDYTPKVPFSGGKRPDTFEGKIEFQGVWFKYPTRDSWVIKNVSFVIEAKQMVAFVGHSGSGKSTILQLICRFYDATVGRILLDDRDITEYDPRWIHRMIGVVQQEPVLFNMSVFDNIAYGIVHRQVTEEEVRNAAEIANASHFINRLPQKYNTIVGEKGTKLSGGQKQRISIARAVIKDPVVMITDEATSALDSQSERKVQIGLDRVLKDRTSIIIAHRLGTIRGAQKIFVFESGELVEEGTYEELLAMNGMFYNLVERQLIFNASKEEITTDSSVESFSFAEEDV